MTLKSIFFVLPLFALLQACNSNPLDVDIADVQVQVSYTNMDSAFVHTGKQQFIPLHHQYLREFRDIYEYELGYCLGINSVQDSVVNNAVHEFINDPYIKRVEVEVETEFSDLFGIKANITNGFLHLKYHFKTGTFPEYVVFMNSFFASNAFATEKQIGVGLERYLGQKSKVIQELPGEEFPEWVKEGMDRKYLERDVLCAWIMTHYLEEKAGNLADEIIRWGKILYLTQAAFPEVEPSVIIRYSDEDYKWAIDNEYAFWKFLVDQKMLFKDDELTKKNMLGDAPFTAGLPEKAPDRLGQFLGYRIVKAYMESTKIPLEELISKPYSEIIVEYQID